MESAMNRRNFLKAAIASGAVIAAGGALAGCSPNGGSTGGSGEAEQVVGTAPVSFSEETDVLILGTGIAGMSAAMDPVEAGHKVMLVDKLDRVGGESFIACGVMNVVGSKMQKDAGIEGDPEQMWEKFLPVLEKKGETDDMDYKHNVYVYQTEWANRVAADYGSVFQPITDYMNTGAPTSMLLPGNGIGDMQAVLTPLQKGLEQKGATYKLNLRATNFIVDGEGAPIGVRFNDEKNNKTVDIRAKKIIVATGGFSCNQEMVSTYLPSQARLGPLTVNSMGEGHQLCKAIGGVYTPHGHGSEPHERPRSGDGVGLLLAASPGNPAGPPLHQGGSEPRLARQGRRVGLGLLVDHLRRSGHQQQPEMERRDEHEEQRRPPRGPVQLAR